MVAHQGSMPAPMPLSGGFHRHALARRRAGRFPDGTVARRVLPRLLLGVDGPAVCWWRDEPIMDSRNHAVRSTGKNSATGRCRGPRDGPFDDRRWWSDRVYGDLTVIANLAGEATDVPAD